MNTIGSLILLAHFLHTPAIPAAHFSYGLFPNVKQSVAAMYHAVPLPPRSIQEAILRCV